MTASSLLNGIFGLKMKWCLEIITVFALLALPSTPVWAQTPTRTQNAPISTSEPPPGAATPSTSTTIVLPPDLSAPTAPVATPAPTAAAPVHWSTQALQESLTLVMKSPDAPTKKKPSKKSKLSDARLDELRAKIARNEKDHKSRQKLADHFDTNDEPEKVIDVLRPAVDSLPRKGLLSLARAYREKKDHKEEVRVLEILIAQKEKDYFAQHALGNAYVSLGRFEDARNHFEEAKKLNPRFRPAYDALLREAKRAGQISEALALLQDMETTFGDKGSILNQACLLYAYQAYLDKATEVCKAAISKDPKNANNHVFLGLIVKEKKGPASAEKILKKAAERFPESELAQWVAGELALEKKNFPLALKMFQRAVKASPSSARSQIGLARAAFEEKSYEEALTAFVEACTLNRTLISDFRKAASGFRRKNDPTWSEKYDAGLAKCGLK